jgi:hypothetical protein
LLARLRRKPRHAAPHAPCECGIYAAGLDQILADLVAAVEEGDVVLVHAGITIAKVDGRRLEGAGDSGGAGGGADTVSEPLNREARVANLKVGSADDPRLQPAASASRSTPPTARRVPCHSP